MQDLHAGPATYVYLVVNAVLVMNFTHVHVSISSAYDKYW
jgi:hypothetical protein